MRTAPAPSVAATRILSVFFRSNAATAWRGPVRGSLGSGSFAPGVDLLVSGRPGVVDGRLGRPGVRRGTVPDVEVTFSDGWLTKGEGVVVVVVVFLRSPGVVDLVVAFKVVLPETADEPDDSEDI